MKKKVLFITLITLLLCLVGCSSQNNDTPSVKEKSEAVAESNVSSIAEPDKKEAYTDIDEANIADTIKNADVLADAGDYEAGLTLINHALEEYPNSKALNNKKQEYEAALNKQGDQNNTDDVEESSSMESTNAVSLDIHSPFYGIWCQGTKDYTIAEKGINDLQNRGFNAQIFVTTDWSNLNSERWYVVTAGVYATESDAKTDLSLVQSYYPDAYIKYSGDYIGSSDVSSDVPQQRPSSAFYGIWCHGSKSQSEAEQGASELRNQGLNAQVFVTTDWSNLNTEKWYVVTAGVYATEDDAKADLSLVQSYYHDAYVKYSGDYIGSGDVSSDVPQQRPSSAFYGIWCHGSKSQSEAEQGASELRDQGFNAQVFVTTDWSNLNAEKWYVVTAGVYATQDEAEQELSYVKAVYPDAYVKYSGEWKGN